MVEVFADFQISVANARIYSNTNGFVLDYFHCLGACDIILLQDLSKALVHVLNLKEYQVKNRELVVTRREKLLTSLKSLSI